MAHSNRPSKRGVPGMRPAYPGDPQERMAALAYIEAGRNAKEERRLINMERTRKGLH